MQLLTPGQNAHMNITRPDGALVFVVLISLFTDGVSLTFTRHPILNRQFTNLAEGREYLRFLKAEAAADTELWLIVERAGAWTTAAATVDDAERELIDGINAAIDGRTTQNTPPVEVADIMADAKLTGGWNGARTRAKNARLYPARRIRPTATNVHTKPLTDVMADLVRSHVSGTVRTRPGQSWTLLRALVERGYADPASVVYRPGTRQIASVRLNARGRQATGQQSEVAA
jgi:hypothetical protein